MARLTTVKKREIQNLLLIHAFAEQIRSLDEQKAAFALKVYEDVFKKDLEKIRGLPKGWLPTKNYIKVEFGGQVKCLYFCGYSPYDNHLPRSAGELVVYPLPNDDCFGSILKQYSANNKLALEFVDLDRSETDLKQKFSETKSAIISALNNITTTKRLVEAWPEAEPIFRDVVSDIAKKGNLPAVQMDALNKVLDLPPSENGAAA